MRLLWSNRIGAEASGSPELDVKLAGARLEKVPRPGARILALHASGAESRFFWCADGCLDAANEGCCMRLQRTAARPELTIFIRSTCSGRHMSSRLCMQAAGARVAR